MKIGVLSDTHGVLDDKVLHFFSECDEIWHAGDVGNIQIMETLAECTTTRGVFGNIDGQPLRSSLPEFQLFSIKTARILMIHIAGNLPRYNQKVRSLIELSRPSILVCGHSHILKVMFDKKNNLLFINPGAAGNHGFHKVKTALRFQIIEDKPCKMELLQLQRHKKKPLL